jgi:hypothetical protein
MANTTRTIKIHNVAHREDAAPLRRLLEGKTFMSLKVGVAPVRGSFDVLVSTDYPHASDESLREMVMSVMASCVLDLSSAPVMRALGEGCNRLEDGDRNDLRAARLTDGRVLEHFGMSRSGMTYHAKEEATAGYLPSNDGSDAYYAWLTGWGEWVYSREGHVQRLPEGTTLYADSRCTVALRAV